MSANQGFILPLCSLDEVRAELADTERSLDRMGEFRVVSVEQFLARRQRLQRWERRLRDQIESMEAESAV